MPFGTIISFDNEEDYGSMKPETGGADLRFERSDISWDSERRLPVIGNRYSYAVDANRNSQPCAVNIQPI
jgi:cold shock CspA family protein